MQLLNSNQRTVEICKMQKISGTSILFLSTPFLMLFVLIMNFGMAGCSRQMPVQALANSQMLDKKVEILAEVISASPLSSGEVMQLKLWTIELRIKRILSGIPDINPDETVVVYVHSVVKTFGVDVNMIKGKIFHIKFDGDFIRDYWDEIEVDNWGRPLEGSGSALGLGVGF